MASPSGRDSQSNSDQINRRRYLSTLSAVAGSAALAGCGGGGGGGDGGGGDEPSEENTDGSDDQGGNESGGQEQLGQRVPTITLVAMKGVGRLGALEQSTKHLIEVLGELGVSAEVTTKEMTTMWSEAYSDERTFNFHIGFDPAWPQYLDPSSILTGNLICNAGANGRPNLINYANCDFSRLAQEQQAAAGSEERRNMIQEALAIESETLQTISLHPQLSKGAWRTDQLNMPDTGSFGVDQANVELFWTIEGQNDNNIVCYPSTSFDTSVTFMATAGQVEWSNLVYSPLLYFDKNLELSSAIATDWEISNNFKTFRFSLREDATFHNGDPVTAEDVKWTFEFLQGNAGSFPDVEEFPISSIATPDEHTVEISMENPAPPFLRVEVPKWGILPKDVWVDAGAEDNPTDVDLEEIVGSGPFEVVNWTPEQVMALEPFDDHFFDPNTSLTFQMFQDYQSAFRAFREGNVNLLFGPPGSVTTRIEDNMTDVATVDSTGSWTNYNISPQHSFGVSKFREFRMALSHAINRNLINNRLSNGDSEPHLYSTRIAPSHPFYPEDHEGLTKVAESPDGDIEAARSILEEAGWGWDEDGNLHYPQDAELEAWPQGSAPTEQSDQFPCVSDIC